MPLTTRLLTTTLLFAAACAGTDDTAEAASGNKFFLPTGAVGTNTSPPTIEMDAAGTLHAVYPAYAGGGAFYAECAAGCSGKDAMKVVSFPTTGTVDNIMMALDKQNHPQLVLVTGADALYASCAGDCTQQASWTVTPILHHGGDRTATGKALALDNQGRPRFLLHTPLAYLGIGQKPPATEWVSCDASCNNPSSWTRSQFSSQILARSSLAFDANNRAHLATVARVEDANSISFIAAYETCTANCGAGASWNVATFGAAYSSESEIVTIHEQTSMALSKGGAPRVAVMMPGDNGSRRLVYFQCNAADCTATGAWTGIVVTESPKLDAGYDLKLDGKDRPRIAFTIDYNIAVAACDAADCAANGATWSPTIVENSQAIPTDQIFLYPNCSVAAWLLHSPSLALSPSGAARVAYTARDVSAGGVHATDPSGPRCTAGTDMLLARMAVLK